ncbi:MAG: amidase [Aquabacterium sp.]
MQAPDLTAAAASVRAGQLTAQLAWDQSRAAADTPAADNVYVRRFDAAGAAAARATDLLRDAGAAVAPLAGLAVSIKDLFDVANQPTTAGSASMAEAPSATRDCTAVARLRAAGAALSGHTNLSEFAFSGVGLNPHFGTPANPATMALDTTPRVPGGSTSGGAVSVACGAAWAALGSDTGGSIRIPAALQGLVGFKNTQSLTPLDGTIPLSSTLDTACAITRSVRDAVLLHGILAARTPRLAGRPLSSRTLGVPRTLMLDDLEPAVARAFDQALSRLSAAGARIIDLSLPELTEVATINASGGFAAAEAWAWHRQRLARDASRYDPRVAQRIRRGEAISAADYIDLQQRRTDWMTRMGIAIAGCDALLSPTVPVVAPVLAPLQSDNAAFTNTNLLLLRNPAVVNLLDGCALSLPCHPAGDWPVGLMVWGGRMADDTVLDIGLAAETALQVR